MTRSRIVRLAIAAAVFAAAGWALRTYITDDTFIHLRFAKNLIARGEFAFNPGQDTYGATSPVWVVVLAVLMKAGLAPATAAWLAGALAGVLALGCADWLVQRMTYAPYWRAVVLAVVATDAWFLRWTFSGMETPLATAVLLALLWPLVSGRDLGWGTTREPLWQRYLAWGALAGFAGLVRPEFLVLAPAALPWLLWFEYARAGAVGGHALRRRARPHGPLAAAVAGWLVVAGPWLFYARLAFGHVTPGTATAKSGSLSLAPDVVLTGLLQSVKQLAATQATLWLALLALMVAILLQHGRAQRLGLADSRQLAADRNAAEAGEGTRPTPGTGPWSVWGPTALVGIAVTWTAVLLAGYAVKQVWVISRYVSPLAPVLVLAMAVVAEWLIQGVATVRSRLRFGLLLRLGVAAYLVANVWLFAGRVVPHARTFSDGVRTCYVGMGERLRDESSPDAVVAALDIGAVGWASERRVLDLMGLVSPEIRELGLGMGFAAMVESGVWLGPPGQQRPTWFVDRCEGAPRWQGRTVGGVRFDLVDTCTIRGVGLREPQPWTIALYRLVSAATPPRSY